MDKGDLSAWFLRKKPTEDDFSFRDIMLGDDQPKKINTLDGLRRLLGTKGFVCSEFMVIFTARAAVEDEDNEVRERAMATLIDIARYGSTNATETLVKIITTAIAQERNSDYVLSLKHGLQTLYGHKKGIFTAEDIQVAGIRTPLDRMKQLQQEQLRRLRDRGRSGRERDFGICD